jgi:H+/gluconate symporter-like permease
MSLAIVVLALALLMVVAYRGFSVVLFAPVCAMLAVLLTDPAIVAPVFSGVFMEKMVGFIKSYLPVFLLGAVFGKVIELSGFARSIVTAVISVVGRGNAMLSIVLVCALLTYGGVSLFVVVFAVYPFAAEMFRQGGIPKRLIPATIALGAFTFTMDALPGTPQIQNIIPTTFFKTDSWAAPWLGVAGALFMLVTGLDYLEWRRQAAARAGESYGTKLLNEPEPFPAEKLPNPWLAVSPLVIVGVMNKVFTLWIPQLYGDTHTAALPGLAKPVVTPVSSLAAIWSLEGALLKLTHEQQEYVAAPGSTIEIPLKVSRTVKLPVAADVVLVGNGEKGSVFAADPVQLPQSVNQHSLKLKIAADAKPGLHLATIRATAMQDGKWPAVSETTVGIYVEAAAAP